MIPILKERVYENNAISFKTVGFLADAQNCQVTEERNGIFEMSFNYPVESLMFQYLREDMLVLAKPNDTDNNQMFRIYEITKPINGVVTINCEHISYELRNYPVKNAALHSVTPHTMIQGIIDLAKNNVSGQDSNINLYQAQSSGRTATSSLDLKLATVRSALGGTEGSVLDKFGGEYKFDNFDIYLPTERGSDSGVIVAYRKNLTDVKLTTSMESSYTGLFPYAVKDEEHTFLSSTQYPTGSISVTNDSGIAERILMRDFSSEFGENEEITSDALLNKAQSFLSNNDINALAASMSVSFVNLWQSEEYKDYAPLEKVGLCDIVTVYYEKLGINLKLKVIKTVYDVISERYIKLELGSPRSDFVATIAQQQKQINDSVRDTKIGFSQLSAEYQQAIADATSKITGNSGGYVRFTLNANDQPEEITIMDTDDTSTATKCWRWNMNGLGYSSTGYSGTYTTAITADGEIVADFITTGHLSAERIRAGMLSSTDGRTYFDLDNDVIGCESMWDKYIIAQHRGLMFFHDKNGSQTFDSLNKFVGNLGVNTYSGGVSVPSIHFNASFSPLYGFEIVADKEYSGTVDNPSPSVASIIARFTGEGNVEINNRLNTNAFDRTENEPDSFSVSIHHASDSKEKTFVEEHDAYNKKIYSFRGQEVVKVEFSTDGGSTYNTTNPSSYSWWTPTHTVELNWTPTDRNSKIRITSKINKSTRYPVFGGYIDYNGGQWGGFADNSGQYQVVSQRALYDDKAVDVRFSTPTATAYLTISDESVYFKNSYGPCSSKNQLLDIYGRSISASSINCDNRIECEALTIKFHGAYMDLESILDLISTSSN